MKKILISLFLIVMITMLVIFLNILFFIRNSIVDLEKLDLNKLTKTESILIYDKEDSLIMDLSLKKQDFVSIDDISIHMINAIVAVEDKRFFEHKGIDYKRLVKAVLNNFKDKKYSQGASTINQQLIKNVYLSTEKTMKRKVQEMYLSMTLENYLTKNQILEYYLNSVLYGKCFYGIKRASLYYFDKEPKELNIEESAMLAGIVQLPNFYNPYKNVEETNTRKNLVLFLMKENHYITDAQYQDGITKYVQLNTNKEKMLESFSVNPIYNAYYDLIIEELYSDYELDLRGNDLKIYTNLNIPVQKTVYDIMQNKYHYFKNDQMQAGIAFLNNKDRTIEAIGGTRSNDLNCINYALIKNQPASAIKPLLIYASLFEQFKISPASLINDQKTYYSNNQELKNWDHLYKGFISIRTALKESRNIPSLKIYKSLDKDKAYKLLKNMNLISTDPYYEAHAMGGFSDGFSSLQMANGFMTLANKGYFKEAKAIRYVKKNEKSIYIPSSETKLLDDSTVFILDDILKEVLQYTSFDLKDMNLKAKTGQSNFTNDILTQYKIPSNATKDSWIIGYNDYATVSVWTGFSKFGKNNYFIGNEIHLGKKMYKFLLENHGIKYKENITIPSDLIVKDYFTAEDKLYLNDNKFSYIYKSDYFYRNSLPEIFYQ